MGPDYKQNQESPIKVVVQRSLDDHWGAARNARIGRQNL